MKHEINVTTGEVIVRDLTIEESIQEEIDRAIISDLNAERIAAEEAKNALKESAMSKLSALGLTDEEIAAIIG
jgi:hypothetical protein